MTSSRAASQTSRRAFDRLKLARCRRAACGAPPTRRPRRASCPSSRTEPFEPNTWKLKPGPGRRHRAQIARHPVLHPEQHRRRVVAVDRHDAAEALTEDLIDRRRTRSIIPSMACTPIGVSPPHGVSSLSARHASGFSTSAFGNVIVASTCRIVPSSPDADLLAQLGHLRMEAAVVAEAERDAGRLRRGDGRFGVGLRQRERLLAEHVLAAPAPPRSPARRAASAASPAPPRRRSYRRAAPRSCRRASASARRQTPGPPARPCASRPPRSGCRRCPLHRLRRASGPTTPARRSPR